MDYKFSRLLLVRCNGLLDYIDYLFGRLMNFDIDRGMNMLSFLSSWVINIVTVSIIIVLFEMLMPNGKTKKIINLITGFILIIAIINPFLSLKTSDINIAGIALRESSYLDKKEIENSSKYMGKTQMSQITEVYKKRVCENISSQLDNMDGIEQATVSVDINENNESESFGEIQKVYITIKKGEKSENTKSIKPVIVVNKVDISIKKESKKAVVDFGEQKLQDSVKENINKTFQIDTKNIVVNFS